MDIQKIREDFPILSRTVYGKPLVYFDNGATTQKPRLVVDALVDEYYSVNANVHRGVHYLSQQATELHEASRETVRQFINRLSNVENFQANEVSATILLHKEAPSIDLDKLYKQKAE